MKTILEMPSSRLSFQTDDSVLREEARGHVFDMLVPLYTSNVGTSHCPNGTTKVDLHPGYHEAGRIAAAFIEGCPAEVLQKLIRTRAPRTLTPRSRAARYRRLKRQQRALDAFVDSLSMQTRADADDREVIENLMLRLQLAVDAGMVKPAEYASLRLDAERRLRQIKRRRKVN